MSDLKSAGFFLKTMFAPYDSGFCEIRMLFKDGVQNAAQSKFVPLPFTGESLRKTAEMCLKESARGWDVYMGVLPRTEAKGTAASVREGAWVWVDIDHKNTDPSDIPAMVADADIVVSSGNGTHAYWSMGIKQITDPERFSAAVRKHQLKVCPGSDPTADLPRVLRVPGTKNWKDRANPRPVTLERRPSLTTASPAPQPAPHRGKLADYPIGPEYPPDTAKFEALMLAAVAALEGGTLPEGRFTLAHGTVVESPARWLQSALDRRWVMIGRGRAWLETEKGQALAQDLLTFAMWYEEQIDAR
jgi:hypothetical protein